MEITAFFIIISSSAPYLRYFAGKNIRDQNPRFAPPKGWDNKRTSIPTLGFHLVRQRRRHKRGNNQRNKISILTSTYPSFTNGFFIHTSSSSSESENQTLVFWGLCLHQIQERTRKTNMSNKYFNCTKKLALCMLMKKPYFVILLVLFWSFLFALFWISLQAEYCNGSSQLFLLISCVVNYRLPGTTVKMLEAWHSKWNAFSVYGVTKKHPTNLLWSPFAIKFALMCLQYWNLSPNLPWKN